MSRRQRTAKMQIEWMCKNAYKYWQELKIANLTYQLFFHSEFAKKKSKFLFPARKKSRTEFE